MFENTAVRLSSPKNNYKEKSLMNQATVYFNRPNTRYYGLMIGACIALYLFYSSFIAAKPATIHHPENLPTSSFLGKTKKITNILMGKRASSTVVYVYSGNDPLYGGNLAHFIRHGIKADDGNNYYIVLQQGDWPEHPKACLCTINCPDTATCGCKCPAEIKPLPPNVKLVYHENKCFDMGTFGELFEKNLIDLGETEYIIILNSSIRGPFLPSYSLPDFRWTDAFTSKINSVVKLVGPTISCGSAQPHVQSFLIATDRIGLEILKKEGALNCFDIQSDAVKYAEIGSSAAMFRNGYSIDSLMMKYDGVDWRLPKYSKCNEGINPTSMYMYDGTTLNPLETLFVKVKARFADARWTNVLQAKKYSEWADLAAEHKQNPLSNDFERVKTELQPSIRATYRKECFDFATYKSINSDVSVALGWSDEQILEHFWNHGFFEARSGVKLLC